MGTTNGCGAEKGWIKPPYKEFFKSSCVIHDHNYNKGGDYIDRLKADQGFLRYLLRDCQKLEGFQAWYFRKWAWIYYYGVRLFGKKHFNNK